MTPTPADNLVSLLSLRASQTPDRVAFRYLGETAGPSECTYSELDRAARAIAARLREGGHRGERVLLLFPPGLEFIQAFLGCLGAGVIAVPAPPPNPLKPKLSLHRLVAIVESARPTFALTLSSVMTSVAPIIAEIPAFRGMRWLATDALTPKSTDLDALEPASPDDVALIQYTSGSTSEPKGAALSHANVMHNVSWFDDGWDHDPSTVLVNWLPAFHDLGLIYGIIAPLCGGFIGIQMSPIDVIQRPATWLRAISAHRATHSCGPNFIYDLCARKVGDDERRDLDLSSWRVALTAAEPVRAETMARFAERFSAVGFRAPSFCPGYGLSEATCKVVAVAHDAEPTVLAIRADQLERHIVAPSPPGPGARTVVSCGRPGKEVDVRIIDPETLRPCASARVGEIWVSGPGVAQSYWNDPRATEECLRARIAGGDGTPFLRTGDLGFLRDNELYITGRIKDMIIVRGANHYPQDIEHTAQEAHACIRAGCCAAFAYESDGEERLVVVAEVERTALATAEVIGAITKAIAEVHGLRAHRVTLLRAGTIPKTTSGKIQRQACKRALFSHALEVIAEQSEDHQDVAVTVRNEIRAKVLDVVSRVGSIPQDTIRSNQCLYNFGIDSLAGVNIAYEIGLLTGRNVPSELVAEHDTLEKLVDYVISLGGVR